MRHSVGYAAVMKIALRAIKQRRSHVVGGLVAIMFLPPAFPVAGSDQAITAASVPTQRDQQLHVGPDDRTFVRPDGSEFFYLSDTAWTAVTRLTPEEMEFYLADRAAKGFTVIQTILVPWDAAWSGDVDGQRPFHDNDESRPNELYWDRVDRWLAMIDEHGMVPAVVPFWLRGRNEDRGPIPEDMERLRAYAAFLGKRYKDTELIWLLGADAPGDAWRQHLAMFAEELERAAGRGLVSPDGLGVRPSWLMTHHPEGGGSSVRLFNEAGWLDFHGLQSGHSLHGHHDTLVDRAWNAEPAKPVVDLEPAYEHITDGLVQVAPGVRLVTDADVRRQAYQAVFAGAAGHAYGCAEVYEFHTDQRGKARWTVGAHWKVALGFAGSGQLKHLRSAMEQLPMSGRIPDQTLIGADPAVDVAQRRRAIRNATGDRVYIYLPVGGTVKLVQAVLDALLAEDPSRVPDWGSAAWRAAWLDPRTGSLADAVARTPAGDPEESRSWVSPTEGYGQDWVLVLERPEAPADAD
jgi:hypothetical protein